MSFSEKAGKNSCTAAVQELACQVFEILLKE